MNCIRGRKTLFQKRLSAKDASRGVENISTL